MKRIIIKFLILGFSVNAFAQTPATKKTFADTKNLIGIEVQFGKDLILEPATLESETQGAVVNRLIYQKELFLGDSTCKVQSDSLLKLKKKIIETRPKRIPKESQWTVYQTEQQGNKLILFLKSRMNNELTLECFTNKVVGDTNSHIASDAFQTAMTLMMNGAKLKKNGEDYRPYKNSQPSPGQPSGLTPAGHAK